MDHNWVWVAIPITGILAGVLTTWIRARHGYPLDRHGRRGEWPRGEEIADLKAAVASRDAIIAKLEERACACSSGSQRTNQRLCATRSIGCGPEPLPHRSIAVNARLGRQQHARAAGGPREVLVLRQRVDDPEHGLLIVEVLARFEVQAG